MEDVKIVFDKQDGMPLIDITPKQNPCPFTWRFKVIKLTLKEKQDLARELGFFRGEDNDD